VEEENPKLITSKTFRRKITACTVGPRSDEVRVTSIESELFVTEKYKRIGFNHKLFLKILQSEIKLKSKV